MDYKRKINLFSFIIALGWTLAIATSLIYNIYNIEKKQNSLVLEHAKNAFEKDLMFRKWIAMHGGVYVYPTKKTPPNPYLAHIKDRDLNTTTGKMLTLMNPAYTLRELMENFSGMYGEKGHITSLDLLNPKNKPDGWETKVLKLFDKTDIREFHEIYNYNGSEHLRYMRVLKVKPSCLKCHEQQGYKVGDNRGGVSITVPMTKYNMDGALEKKNTIYAHLLILIASFIAGAFIYKKVMATIIHEEKVQKELLEKEKLLEEQAKLVSMGEMIGNIAHQWRQPLSVISTAATGIQMEKEFNTLSDEFLNETCEMINTNAQYLSRTIDDFKNFIKGDKKKEFFYLDQNIQSFLSLVKGSLKNHNIELYLNLEENLKLESFPNELIQCYINIFNNAKDELKTIDENDRLLYIDSYKENNNVVISFKDSAGGIDDDILPRVFEPYFTTKHQTQGTGIGLHMTYNIVVNGLHGSIVAKNITIEHENKKYEGACFIIKIPITCDKDSKINISSF